MLGDRTSTETVVSADATEFSPVALLLVVHGSRNSRYNAAVKQLKALVDRQLRRMKGLAQTSKPLVDVGVLEVHPLPLHQQIASFADRAVKQGIYRIQVLPLFLLAGVHVIEDIPGEVLAAGKILDPNMTLEIVPYLGTQTTALSRLLMSQMVTVQSQEAATVWILFSHGSRRPGGNDSVEAIADQLAILSGVQVVTAYSFVLPCLSDRVAELVKIGHRRMTILPYVLFPGELTKAIADSVTELSQIFGDLQLNVAQPIGATDDLAKFILSIPEN